MKKIYSVGIDIGGTNTDCVVLDQRKNIVAWGKTLTTEFVADGFKTALVQTLAKAAISFEEIDTVLVGTTHATNAILQAKNLYKVGVVRLAGNKPQTLPPCYGWSERLQEAVLAGVVTVNGGFECNGKVISSPEEYEIRQALQFLYDAGAESFAVIGVFSPMNHEQEEYVGSLIRDMFGINMPVTLSYKIAGIGFIERENSSILNAALVKSMKTGFGQLVHVLRDNGCAAELYITQNNGTLLDIAHACLYPVLTISAGPTNSFIGGVRLAGLDTALVVDIGGTSTDVGIVVNGFPRRSINSSSISDIRLNFSMPDVLSIALGGGSYIKDDGGIFIGPESAGKAIVSQAQCYGGTELTLTDCAVLAGVAYFEKANSSLVKVDKMYVREVLKKAAHKIADLVTLAAGPDKYMPVVVVGGGAVLIDRDYLQSLLPDRVIVVPEKAGIANALGAALAEISAVIDTVTSLERRSEVLSYMRNALIQELVARGSSLETIRIVDEEIIPYHYMPQSLARVIITAVGARVGS